MRQTYRLTGLLLVTLAVGLIAGYRITAALRPPPAEVTAPVGECCAIPLHPGAATTAPPVLPPASGLPALVEFISETSEICRATAPVLEAVMSDYQGQLEVVFIDSDHHPGETQKWHPRLVPTQLLLSAEGTELWRHEGYIPLPELQQVIKEHLDIEPPPADPQTP